MTFREAQEKMPKVQGLTLKEAIQKCEEAGFRHRISRIDGRGMMLTCDVHPDRVNFEIKVEGGYTYKDNVPDDAIVVRATLG